jgi:hypothetical protein
MSKMHQSKKGMCDTYQRKILMIINDKSSFEAEESLNNHINICPVCQKFVNSLHLIQGQMQRSPLGNLKPRSRILKNITHTLQLKQEFKWNGNESVWDRLRQIFEYRIPVYQAVSSLLVLMFLFMFLFSQFSSPGDIPYPMDRSGSMKGLNTSDLYALDSLHLLKRERGQNATEDSVLIGFLVPSL